MKKKNNLFLRRMSGKSVTLLMLYK